MPSSSAAGVASLGVVVLGLKKTGQRVVNYHVCDRPIVRHTIPNKAKMELTSFYKSNCNLIKNILDDTSS